MSGNCVANSIKARRMSIMNPEPKPTTATPQSPAPQKASPVVMLMAAGFFLLVIVGGIIGAMMLFNSVPQTRKADAVKGKALFAQTCATCHGQDGAGMIGRGPDLTESKFVGRKTDEELLEFTKVGRKPSDPESVMGLLMMPKGGNNHLTDDDIRHIIAYMRTIHTSK
jgi:ubiquinol-cytochrome c reductase cytochrome c subunit